jgi:hypothetical protein
MGESILSGPNIPTKLPATKNDAVVQTELAVEGLTWHVTCVSMGNPHCVTFGTKESKVIDRQIDSPFMSNCFFVKTQISLLMSKLHPCMLRIHQLRLLSMMKQLNRFISHTNLYFLAPKINSSFIYLLVQHTLLLYFIN